MDSHMVKFIFIVWALTQLHSTYTIGAFDMHHLYSDEVTTMLAVNNTPRKGTSEYYSALASRDRVRLQKSSPAVTSSPSGDTTKIHNLDSLYYANISIGTPSLSFLVAVDTGSSIAWLPCNCTLCSHSYITDSGGLANLNTYDPHSSSTSSIARCGSPDKTCDFQITYGDGSYTKGIYVRDVLRLATYEVQPKHFDTEIIFGCSTDLSVQFLDGGGINGMLGLGPNDIDKIDVPDILENKGIVGNSFSMCFSLSGHARLIFGDKGEENQGETPLDLTHRDSSGGYNAWVTKIAVNDVALDVNISTMFDTGTTFTHLSDPAYTFVTKHFVSGIKEPRVPRSLYLDDFEYCFRLRPNQTAASTWSPSSLNLTMKGGNVFHVITPIFVAIYKPSKLSHYCLAIMKSPSGVNVIGQNFMTGYRIVFDNKKSVLGWKASSNCEANDYNVTTYPVQKKNSAQASPPAFASLVMVVLIFVIHSLALL